MTSERVSTRVGLHPGVKSPISKADYRSTDDPSTVDVKAEKEVSRDNFYKTLQYNG